MRHGGRGAAPTPSSPIAGEAQAAIVNFRARFPRPKSSQISYTLTGKPAAVAAVFRVVNPMLHDHEKANLQQTLERTRAALGVFADFDLSLRLIRNGMAPAAEKSRVEAMMRLNRDTIAALERKLVSVEREMAAPEAAQRSEPSRTGTVRY